MPVGTVGWIVPVGAVAWLVVKAVANGVTWARGRRRQDDARREPPVILD